MTERNDQPSASPVSQDAKEFYATWKCPDAIMCSSNPVVYYAAFAEAYASHYASQQVLYCDICGEELQREACNHVRPCDKCTAQLKEDNERLTQKIANWQESYLKLKVDLTAAESTLASLKERVPEALEALRVMQIAEPIHPTFNKKSAAEYVEKFIHEIKESQ